GQARQVVGREGRAAMPCLPHDGRRARRLRVRALRLRWSVGAVAPTADASRPHRARPATAAHDPRSRAGAACLGVARHDPSPGRTPGLLMAGGILDDIVRDKREELRQRTQATPLAVLEARCRDLPPARDFEEALRARPGVVRLIAEVKKASPSRGVFAPTLDPVALATAYARHGADAISVLT